MKNKLPVIFLLAFLASHVGWSHNGTINGQVIEKSSGLELPGAVVKLEPGGTYVSTNELGFFSFSNLEAGAYTITVSFLGFETTRLDPVPVRNSETTVIRIEMTESAIDLKDVEISSAVSEPFKSVSSLDIRIRPISSTQDVLRVVPGLFIAQHAGGGKAEQIFLRGFDIDHGTDINLSVDGMPVNMVSHAHGQGYADLHFVIPELIRDVTFKKGPYYADSGDFTTAGLVRFQTVDALERSMIRLEAGQFQTGRIMGAFKLDGKAETRRNKHAFLAAEAQYTDGYFEQPQQFTRFNLFGKYNALFDDDQRITLSVSAFQSEWDASGQIPERAVASGQIGRFGAIDPTEGGNTGRYNLNVEHLKSLSANALIKNQFYVTAYNFELYSNFTFYKNDPVYGDQIRQKESRRLVGYQGAFTSNGQLLHYKLESEAGLFFRSDATAGSELSSTFQRDHLLGRKSWGDIKQINLGAYWTETLHLHRQFSLQAGLRYDRFLVSYLNKLDSLFNRQQANAGTWSPKLNLFFDPVASLRLYLSGGYGFHSNDARVVVPRNGLDILPKAAGADFGLIYKPAPSLYINAAAWILKLDQEFVYVGDEAIVEAGGKTKRLGLDLSTRIQLLDGLFADADLTWSHARTTDDPEGENFIPLAPKFTATGGLNWGKTKGFNASVRFRHLGDRPANEDGSLVAKGYFLLDAVTGWKTAAWELDISVQNLTGAAWKEAQFETESRLKTETESVSEIHYTPGTPFFLKAGFTFKF